MNENRKSCVDCKATKTPLWRTGPAGPRSLCNACGIRYRKRKASEDVGRMRTSNEGAGQERGDKQQSCTSTAFFSSHDGDGNRRESMKLKLVDLGTQMMLQRAESPFKKQRNGREGGANGRKLGEVEEAAFLLMSLSCDPVFA